MRDARGKWIESRIRPSQGGAMLGQDAVIGTTAKLGRPNDGVCRCGYVLCSKQGPCTPPEAKDGYDWRYDYPEAKAKAKPVRRSLWDRCEAACDAIWAAHRIGVAIEDPIGCIRFEHGGKSWTYARERLEPLTVEQIRDRFEGNLRSWGVIPPPESAIPANLRKAVCIVNERRGASLSIRADPDLREYILRPGPVPVTVSDRFTKGGTVAELVDYITFRLTDGTMRPPGGLEHLERTGHVPPRDGMRVAGLQVNTAGRLPRF